MPKGKTLSDEEKGRVHAFHETGLTIAEIARRIGRSRGAVRNVIDSKLKNKPKKRVGRPPKLSPRDKRRVIGHFSNSMSSLRKAPAALNLNVSRETVRRALAAYGTVKHEKKKHAPALTVTHKQARIKFARDNFARDWKKVPANSL